MVLLLLLCLVCLHKKLIPLFGCIIVWRKAVNECRLQNCECDQPNIVLSRCCYSTVAIVRQEPLASTHDVRHKVVAMDLDERRKLLITVGRDRIVKVQVSFVCAIVLYMFETARIF